MTSQLQSGSGLNVNLNLNLDINNLITSIRSWTQQMGRAEFVITALDETIRRLARHPEGNKYYILILSRSQEQRSDLVTNDVLICDDVRWSQGADAHDFKIVVFKSGSIRHENEHGGYINWAFTGGHRSGRNGGNVVWPPKDTNTKSILYGGYGGSEISPLNMSGQNLEKIIINYRSDISAIIFQYSKHERIVFGNFDRGKKNTEYEIMEGEYITGAHIKTDSGLKDIKFITNLGRHLGYAAGNGCHYEHKLDFGGPLKRIGGRTGHWIDAIQFYY